jgi:hypothetical protein
LHRTVDDPCHIERARGGKWLLVRAGEAANGADRPHHQAFDRGKASDQAVRHAQLEQLVARIIHERLEGQHRERRALRRRVTVSRPQTRPCSPTNEAGDGAQAEQRTTLQPATPRCGFDGCSRCRGWDSFQGRYRSDKPETASWHGLNVSTVLSLVAKRTAQPGDDLAQVVLFDN